MRQPVPIPHSPGSVSDAAPRSTRGLRFAGIVGARNNPQSTIRNPQSAFTLIELLVVIVVLLIMAGSLMSVGQAVLRGSKESDTRMLMQTLDLALRQFQVEAPLQKVPNYNRRYVTNAPPDEIQVFVNGLIDVNGTIPDDEAVNIAPDFSGGLKSTTQGLTANQLIPQHPSANSMKAFDLAIRLFCPEAGVILDRVDRRFIGREKHLNGEYLDRKDLLGGISKEFWVELNYYVDSWGQPIQYFATKDNRPTGVAPWAAGDTQQPVGKDYRRFASAAIVAANGGLPVFVSYGPDGEDQFKPDNIADPSVPAYWDIVYDFHDTNYNGVARAIDHPLNADNVYSNPDLAQKLQQEQPEFP